MAIAPAAQRGLAEAGVCVVAVEDHVPVPVPAASDGSIPSALALAMRASWGMRNWKRNRDELEWREARLVMLNAYSAAVIIIMCYTILYYTINQLKLI